MKSPEEIKKGLEYLATTDVTLKAKLAKRGLPYAYAEDIASDALTLIRQLEAKVVEYEKPLVPLTLEEAYEADCCYIEDNVKGSSEPHAVLLGMMTANSRNEKRVVIMEFGEDVDYCVKLSCEAYGKTWRCWPRRPTDKERKAAKWDD